jgi:hypothetical protein
MKSIRTVIQSVTAVALVASATSCGNVVRDGRSPSFLVIQKLVGVQGSTTASGTGAIPLTSDVITMVTTGGACSPTAPCPTFFNDTGIATLSLAQKDVTSAAPTTNNQVTITRVHVSFVRTDGLNREGVDVPYSFDTAVTITVPISGAVDVPFEVVRNSAKLEEPLLDLRSNHIIVSMIANITFYGTDQVGNAINATGTLQVDFGNFSDK